MRTLLRWTARLLLLALGALLAWQLWLLAHVVYWKYHNPVETSFMDLRLDQLRAKDAKARLRHQWVPYERISIHLKRAIIVAEDDKFVDHEGFDWDAIQKALEQNRKQGRVVRGGSTISQQLAKNLFLSDARTPTRKVQEAAITLMLEQTMDKRRILEIYLNVIEWGNGVFGAEAAARHYFGVSAAQLTPAQAAMLAAMVPNPRFYDRNRGSRWLARYTEIILSRMPRAVVP
ncbi:MAG: monofunctional biosynthetic peptidoglycan transglycosylase [Proteobacteria bacterium]|jgi:monofunctional biosynthetic peptidoglycan transglycosylase|nr:monofunctional biosynthetic peptidoglycan transglycosylase [Pseudomonadota bacterium]